MRTDSVRVSDDAQEMAKELYCSNYGEKYYPESPNIYAKGKQNVKMLTRLSDLPILKEPLIVSRNIWILININFINLFGINLCHLKWQMLKSQINQLK